MGGPRPAGPQLRRDGPDAGRAAGLLRSPGAEPIRAYAGLASADTVGDRAALAVRDLQRAGGFDRKVLVVVTTTGTGWVDPAASDSLEYEFNGDTAMVAMQYSYLPSWMSFLVDQAKARDAGRALFDAVYGAWAQLPPDHRPKLYVFGESLGTFGGEAAFSGLADIANRTDGVLWAGPPNFNPLWREVVDDREAGIARSGCRCTTTAGPSGSPTPRPTSTSRPGPGASPGWPTCRTRRTRSSGGRRNLILCPSGLAARAARAGRDPARCSGCPFVTFWQVTADLVFSNGVPDGHGHKYEADYVNGWAHVAQPPGWTTADTERLRALIG